MSCNNIVIPGAFDIFIGLAENPNQLEWLGMSIDSLEFSEDIMLHDVYSDRNGGRSGAPIARLFLGKAISSRLTMAEFSRTAIDKIERVGGLLADAGKIPDQAIGADLLCSYAMRFLFRPKRDVTRTRNLPTVVVSKPHFIGGGSKNEEAVIALEAYRGPRGTYKAEVLFDSDITGIPATY